MKYERFFHEEYQDIEETRLDTEASISYHDYQRSHQGIDPVPPHQRHAGQLEEILARRKWGLAEARESRKLRNRERQETLKTEPPCYRIAS